MVVELSTSSDLMFEVLLYWNEEEITKYDLIQKSQLIKSALESRVPWLSWIDLVWANTKMWFGDTSSDYEILVLLG